MEPPLGESAGVKFGEEIIEGIPQERPVGSRQGGYAEVIGECRLRALQADPKARHLHVAERKRVVDAEQ